MAKRVGKFVLFLKHLRSAYMHMLLLALMSEERKQNEYLADLTQENCERHRRSDEVLDPKAPKTRDKWNVTQVGNHDLFPFSGNLTTLVFIVASDLSDDQKEGLASSVFLQGMHAPAYTFEEVKQCLWNCFVRTKHNGAPFTPCRQDTWRPVANHDREDLRRRATDAQRAIKATWMIDQTWDDNENAWQSRPSQNDRRSILWP